MRSEILTATYDDVRSLLDSIVVQHQRKFGGHLEDLRADANSLFVEAYDLFDEERGNFFHWIKYFVWIKLLYARRLNLKESKRYSSLQDVGRNDPNYFDLEDFIGGLSQDADYLVRLALNPPRVVLQGVPESTGGCGEQGQGARANVDSNKGRTRAKAHINKGAGRPKTIGAALRRYLVDLGWSVRRVASTFQEVRDAL